MTPPPPARPAAQRTYIEVDGRPLEVTHPDRMLWPDAGFTKRDMIRYYLDVADALIRHVAGRALTLKRAPEGVDGGWWYQQECPHPPDWVRTARVRGGTSDKIWNYCVADDVATLIWLANLGCIEFHPLLFPVGDMAIASQVVFDLDPGPPAHLLHCCEIALRLRALLEDVGLRSFVKTSGLMGLHVHVPLGTEHSFAQTKAFARGIARRLVQQYPDRVVARKERKARAGKVFVDWAQNDTYRSVIAPYSLRLAPLPLVAVPLSWHALEAALAERDLRALTFLPDQAIRRLAGEGDPLAPAAGLRQRLPAGDV